MNRMKEDLSDATDLKQHCSTLKDSIDLLTKQLKDKEDELKKCHQQVTNALMIMPFSLHLVK